MAFEPLEDHRTYGALVSSSHDPRRWYMLPVILSATFMALFDFFVVNVAAPSLQQDLHASQAELELIVGGYAFTYASGMVTGGRLGDLLGYRRLFLAGMAAFTLASLLCGLAQTPAELTAARLLQGLTGAAMVPQVLALITATFPADERPRAMSWFGVTAGIGSVAGQVLGGLLLQADLFGLGWRVIFLINVPVGMIALVFALRLLPHHRASRRPRLDPLGALGVSGALALVLVPLILGREEGWPLWGWVAMVASVPVMLVTLAWERRLTRQGGEPLLDLTLFRNRSFAAGLPVNVAFMAFFASFMFVLTLLLQGGLGLTPLAAGLTFMPLGVLFAVSSVLGRSLVARYGLRVMTVGASISAAGLASLIIELQTLGGDITTAWVIAPTAVVGLGNGLVLPTLIGAVLAGIQPEHGGAAAGVLTTTQQFASAAGVAVLGAVFFGALGPNPSRASFAGATESVMFLVLALVLTTAVLTLLLPRRDAARVPQPEAERNALADAA
jgi:EmrB/QacA subfamily drug resistance transporter